MLDYDERYNKDDRLIKARVIIDGHEIDKKYIKNFKISEIFNSTDNLTFGNFCTNTFELEMFKNEVLLAERSKVELFMKTDEIETPLGVFFVNTIEVTERMIKISGFDQSALLTNKYQPNIEFPATLREVLTDICEQNNLQLSKRIELPTIEINGYLDDKETETKTIIAYVAGLMGKNARIDPYGHLIFNWYEETGKIITRKVQYLGGLVMTSDEVTIHSVTCHVGDQELSSGEGFGITIENPFMTQPILDNIADSLNNFSYNPCVLDFRGNPTFELGDIVSVETTSNTYIKALISKRETVYSGGLKTTLTSIGNSELKANVSRSPTEVKMKKLYNMLQESFKQSTETILGHNGGYFTIDTDLNGRPTGWSIMDTPELNETTHLWKMTMGGFAYSSNGGKTFSNIAIDMNGNISGNALSIGVIQGEFFDIDLNNGTIRMGKRDEYGEIKTPDFYIDHTGVVIFNAIKELEEKIDNIDINKVSVNIESNAAVLNSKNSFVTLLARVTKDGEDIGNSLLDINFSWFRVSDDKEADIEWNAKQLKQSSINVGYNDVDYYANFYCKVTTTFGIFISNYLTVTDETDISNLQVYINANQPNYQGFDNNYYSPDWSGSDHLVLTPIVLDNYLHVPLSECQITWQKINGELDETETVKDGILTVAANKLDSITRSIGYIASVKYRYSSLSKTIEFTNYQNQEETEVGEVTYYTWVYYADNPHGDGISDNPKDKLYIGIANMQIEKEPPYTIDEEGNKIYSDLSAFVWTKMMDYRTVLEQDGEPADTSCLWLDSNTGQLKKYYTFLKSWAPINDETPLRDTAENVYVTTEKSSTANFTILSNAINSTVKNVERVESELGSQMSEVSSKIEQNAANIQFSIEKISEITSGLASDEALMNEMKTYFKFDEQGLHISKSDNSFEMILSDTELGFYDGKTRVAYISNKRLYIEQVVVVQSLQIGDYTLRYDNDIGFVLQ